MTFVAQYRSDCGDCDEPIKPGQQVEYRDSVVCHAVCPDAAPVETREPCPRCWMVPSLTGVCGCDS